MFLVDFPASYVSLQNLQTKFGNPLSFGVGFPLAHTVLICFEQKNPHVHQFFTHFLTPPKPTPPNTLF